MFQSPEQRAEMLANLAPEEHASSDMGESASDVKQEGTQEVEGTTSAAQVADQDHGQDESTDNGLIPRSRYNEVAQVRDELKAKIAELEKQLSDRREPEPEKGVDDLLREIYKDPDEATVDPDLLDFVYQTHQEVARLRQEREAEETQSIINTWKSEIGAERARLKETFGVEVPESWFWRDIRFHNGQLEVSEIAKQFESFVSEIRPGPPTTPRAEGGSATHVRSGTEPVKKKEISSVSDATSELRRAMGL